MTKHANALLCSRPPARPYAHVDVQAEVDALPQRRIASSREVKAPVESYTVTYERDGSPSRAIISCLLADGSRALAHSTRPETVDAVLESGGANALARLSASGEFELCGA